MPALICLLFLGVAFGCVSCGDDPKLEEKHERQKAAIVRLRAEVALIEEKLKNLPPDVSADLRLAEKKAEEQQAGIVRLQAEISALQARKIALQKEYDRYRAKHPLK